MNNVLNFSWLVDIWQHLQQNIDSIVYGTPCIRIYEQSEINSERNSSQGHIQYFSGIRSAKYILVFLYGYKKCETYIGVFVRLSFICSLFHYVCNEFRILAGQICNSHMKGKPRLQGQLDNCLPELGWYFLYCFCYNVIFCHVETLNMCQT